MVTYRDGDLLESKCEVICHQTNCKGVMGSGIARTIRVFYPEAYEALRRRYEQGEAKLGVIDLVPTLLGGFMRCVVNCYGEYDYLPRGVVHTDYEALQKCFNAIAAEFEGSGYTIGFPYKIGCGLAGGDWDIVSKMIENTFEGDKWKVEIWRLN